MTTEFSCFMYLFIIKNYIVKKLPSLFFRESILTDDIYNNKRGKNSCLILVIAEIPNKLFHKYEQYIQLSVLH